MARITIIHKSIAFTRSSVKFIQIKLKFLKYIVINIYVNHNNAGKY